MPFPTPFNLRQLIQHLKQTGELREVHAPVDPYLEIAEIHRRVVQQQGPALWFKNVLGSKHSIVTNLYGSAKRLEIAFGGDPSRFVQDLIPFVQEPNFSLKTLWEKRNLLLRAFTAGTKKRPTGPIMEEIHNPPALEEIPFITSWPDDGGAFATLPLVYTTSPNRPHKSNLGMYRIQRFDTKTTGLHFQIGKGGGFHFQEAERQNQPLPVSIFLGGPPALTLAAIAPLPEMLPELLFASFIMGKKIPMIHYQNFPHPIPAEAEFALLGYAPPHKRRLEGPFGDHFGYYSLAHEFPYLECETRLSRKNAILPATVVGIPPQEDLFIGELIQKIFSPLLPLMIPALEELHTYGEAGFHGAAAIRVRERYEKEAFATALRILGEGQLSLTKCLLVTDAKVPLHDFSALLEAVLERLNPQVDVVVFGNTANDTLDYTGPKLNHGSKLLLFGMKKPRQRLPKAIPEKLPGCCRAAGVFCPGCLVISLNEGTPPEELVSLIGSEWPMVVIVDSVAQALSSPLQFAWQLFTRFEPARDLYAKKEISRNQVRFSFPLVFDCRMKSFYPNVVEVDQTTASKVDTRWHSYFHT